MDIFCFDLRPHEGCDRPITPLRGHKWHEGSNLLKKVFNKSCSATSKTPLILEQDRIMVLYIFKKLKIMQDIL